MADILIAHAPGAGARAALVEKKLKALGFAVKPAPLGGPSPLARRETQKAIEGASRLVLLWSADAAQTPGLISAAARAQAAGKLAVARLDSAAPPAALRTAPVDLSRWGGKDNWRSWRAFVSALGPAAAATTPAARPATRAATARAAAALAEAEPPKKKGAPWLLILLAVVLIAGWAAAILIL